MLLPCTVKCHWPNMTQQKQSKRHLRIFPDGCFPLWPRPIGGCLLLFLVGSRCLLFVNGCFEKLVTHHKVDMMICIDLYNCITICNISLPYTIYVYVSQSLFSYWLVWASETSSIWLHKLYTAKYDIEELLPSKLWPLNLHEFQIESHTEQTC